MNAALKICAVNRGSSNLIFELLEGFDTPCPKEV